MDIYQQGYAGTGEGEQLFWHVREGEHTHGETGGGGGLEGEVHHWRGDVGQGECEGGNRFSARIRRMTEQIGKTNEKQTIRACLLAS